MPAPIPSPATRPARFGGLDGLRAIAVGLVLVYHLFPGALPGGFFGVDVFFVISGFLITSLLLRELSKHGRIRLLDFWRRRARRLLPALGLTLLVCTSLGALLGGDLLVRIGSQIAGAALFISNWVLIAGGTDYFTRDTPELFRNTWSLAIEEQFYIVLPFLVLLLFKLRSTRTGGLILLGLAAISSALMWSYSLEGVDATRIYFGSDSHTFGLFLGAALAAFLHRGVADEKPLPTGARYRFGQAGSIVATLAGLAVLAWCALNIAEGSPESFQGGFQLATVASLVIVWAITRVGSPAGRLLDIAPMRWVGERSYGIYLWHWPLHIIIGAANWRWLDAEMRPWAISFATLIATLVAAALSFRYIEQPVRELGLFTSLKLMFRPSQHGPRRRKVAIWLAVLLVVTLPASAWAVTHAPKNTSAADAILRGQDALVEQTDADKSDKTDADKSDKTDADKSDKTDADKSDSSDDKAASDGKNSGKDKDVTDDKNGKDNTDKSDADKPLPIIAPEGRDLTAIGDSVMLASVPELNAALPGISIDAAVSRGLGAGIGIAEDLMQSTSMASILVIGLGTNGPIDTADLDTLRAVSNDRPMVLVNAHADRDWIPGVNQALAEYATAHRGVVLADWDESVTGVEGALAGDDIHPNSSGGEIYAAAVQRALDELATPAEVQGWGYPRR